ncbi:hypothetical protein RB653_001086 [Dictyostelium firmibasis]|uniref:PSP proline-rich domain-containing protein n=1 Tax=Dictyostelium firmibasis TaxID=79012 RepID=A0AAN7UG69_9MYCE
MDTTLAETIQNNNNKSINKKKLKQQKKKEQKKKQKQHKKEENILQQQQNDKNTKEESYKINEPLKIENEENEEIVSTTPIDGFSVDENDPSFELFSKLVKHFDNPYEDLKEIERKEQEEQEEKERKEKEEDEKKNKDNDNDDDDDDEDSNNNNDDEDDDSKKLSNKERKRQRKLHLPILKQLVDRPDVVELHDVNSPNPGYLIAMKSYRNTIPVPAHWCQKKKYLQGKRGFVKPPFELPSFIAATGITKIREAILEKEKEMKSKQKQRERVQPKLRKMGIDYEILRDAFFVHQTKPNLTIQGDLYYEGKEFEVNLKNKKPGVLSDELKRALGMIEGYPPPWLIYMQTYGPPPSYPNLKIPGVNAPIPEGAQYGFHPGGWGRPVLNEFGKPLYENVNNGDQQPHIPTREYWGELLPESEDFREEEEQLEEEDEQSQQQQQQQHLEDDETIGDGISSVPSGLETPDIVNIKKSKYDPQSQQTRELYQVIEQQNRNSSTGGLMESSHRYNIPSIIKQQQQQQSPSSRVDIIKSQRSAPVEITLNPSEIENGHEIDEELLKKKYEQATQALQRPKEDVSDIIEEQSKKRKTQLQKEEKQKKFKF